MVMDKDGMIEHIDLELFEKHFTFIAEMGDYRKNDFIIEDN